MGSTQKPLQDCTELQAMQRELTLMDQAEGS